MLLILGSNALHNLYRICWRRLIHLNTLETALKRSILLNRLVILLKRCGADTLKLAASKSWLEDIGSIHRALRSASTDHCMDFIEKKNNVTTALRFVDDFFETLLKLTAILRPCHDPRHIKRNNALGLHLFGNFATMNGLRKPLHHCRLAYACLANENCIVLGSTGKNLNNALKLFVSADYGIKLPKTGKLRKIAAESIDRRRLGALLPRRDLLALGRIFAIRRSFFALCCFSTAWSALRSCGHELIKRNACVEHELSGSILPLAKHRRHEAHGINHIALAGNHLGNLKNFARTRCKRQSTALKKRIRRGGNHVLHRLI